MKHEVKPSWYTTGFFDAWDILATNGACRLAYKPDAKIDWAWRGEAMAGRRSPTPDFMAPGTGVGVESGPEKLLLSVVSPWFPNALIPWLV